MRIMLVACLAIVTSGCASTNLNYALSAPKNPQSVLGAPNKTIAPGEINPFVEANYRILLEATNLTNNVRTMQNVGNDNMRRYLGAGMALSDIYCEGFFRRAEEARQRRQFGRSLTNDVGTAFTTVLGLANAAKDVVTGAAAAFGLADSAWRNYDDAFSLSPDLSKTRALVLAAQDKFRKETLLETNLPGDYGTAQSVILRFANMCSTLGIRELLDNAASKEKTNLNNQTRGLQANGAAEGNERNTGEQVNTDTPAAEGTDTADAADEPVEQAPTIAPANDQPPLAPNRSPSGGA